jgi:hypothetical protein
MPMSALQGVADTAELYDSEGELLGVFVPANLNGVRKNYDDVKLTISEEEIQRRLGAKEKGYTTREIFEHLLTLTHDEPTREHLRKLIEEVKERDRCHSQ